MNDAETTPDRIYDSVWTPQRRDDIPAEKMRRIENILNSLPELPHQTHRIIEMSTDEESHLDELVEILTTDPVLVSHILKQMNSSYYAINRRIDNLYLAVVMLGFKEVRNIALRSCITRALGDEKKSGGVNTLNLWSHSRMVAVIAESFGDSDNQKSRGVLLTLGLLHDIGKFALLSVAMLLKKNGLQPPNTQKVAPNDYLLKKEDFLFGVNHTVIGGMLAEKWNMPERMVAVLECHHYPSFFGLKEIPYEYRYEITAVSIADLLVNHYAGAGNALPVPHPAFFEIIDSEPQLEDLLTDERRKMLDRISAEQCG